MNIQRNHFNRAKEYSKHIDFSKDNRVQLILSFLKGCISFKKTKVLDIGIGDGYMYRDISNKCTLYGVDIAPDLVKVANKNDIKAFTCDIENKSLPFHDNFFDVVVLGETIEHIVNTDFVLSEVNRVLKKNGSVIITFPNVNTCVSIFIQIFFDHPPMFSARFRSVHVRDWTKKMIEYAFSEYGFFIEKNIGTGLYIPKIGYVDMCGFLKKFRLTSSFFVVLGKKQKICKYNLRKITEITSNA